MWQIALAEYDEEQRILECEAREQADPTLREQMSFQKPGEGTNKLPDVKRKGVPTSSWLSYCLCSLHCASLRCASLSLCLVRCASLLLCLLRFASLLLCLTCSICGRERSS